MQRIHWTCLLLALLCLVNVSESIVAGDHRAVAHRDIGRRPFFPNPFRRCCRRRRCNEATQECRAFGRIRCRCLPKLGNFLMGRPSIPDSLRNPGADF